MKSHVVVPLAPAVIKSLANNLAKSPTLIAKGLSLTRAQSIETMSRILGHESWYWAQRQDIKPPEPSKSRSISINLDNVQFSVPVLLSNVDNRRRFYNDMAAMTAARIDLYNCAKTIMTSGSETGDPQRYALGYHFVEHLAADKKLGDFFECLSSNAPFELMALRSEWCEPWDKFQEALGICP